MSRYTNVSGFTVATITNAVAGTPVQGADVAVPEGVLVVVKGHPDNTGTITIASSSAAAVNTTATCDRLAANQSVSLQIKNTNQIWADATVAGERALITFENPIH